MAGQAYSLYSDESRNSKDFLGTPAFAVQAAVTGPADDLIWLNNQTNRALDGLVEAKWHNLARKCQGNSLAPCETVLTHVFNAAAENQAIKFYTMALNGADYSQTLAAMTQGDDTYGIKASAGEFSHLMGLSYAFMIQHNARHILTDDEGAGRIHVRLDKIDNADKPKPHLHAYIDRAVERIRQDHAGRGLEADLHFLDSARTPMIMAADILAGAVTAAFDPDAYINKKRITAMQKIATGLSQAAAAEAPKICNQSDWHSFIVLAAADRDIPLTVARPYINPDLGTAESLRTALANVPVNLPTNAPAQSSQALAC